MKKHNIVCFIMIIITLSVQANASEEIGDSCTERVERVVAVSPAGLYATDSYPPVGHIVDFFNLVASELCIKPTYYASTIETVFDEVSLSHDGYRFADIGIGPLTMTHDREAKADFVVFDMSPLAIMVRDQSKTDFEVFVSAICSPTVLSIFGIFMFWKTILGGTIGFLEHGDKLSFRNFRQSHKEGSWAAFKIMTNYDIPRFMGNTVRGRWLTKFMWATGMLLIITLSAKFTAELTVEGMGAARYSQKDLWDKRVATKKGTFAASELKKYTSHILTYRTIDDAISALNDGKVDVVVHDQKMLKIYMIEHPEVKLALTGNTFAPRAYGLILPNQSPDREKLQLAVLKVLESNEYGILGHNSFGE